MTSSVKALCCIVLAAGNSSRYGSPKILAPVDGIPMLRRAVVAALEAETTPLVITGAYPQQAAAALEGLRVECLHNEAWAEGMGASIGHAFTHLRQCTQTVSAALVMPTDQVLIGPAQLGRLIAAHREQPESIIAAQYAGALGIPCVFPASDFTELSGLQGAQGARALLTRHASRVQPIAMPEAETDIDTPIDYAAFMSSSPSKPA